MAVNPIFKPGIKPGTHRLGGVGVVKKIKIKDIRSPQHLVNAGKVAKLARFTKNMPGTPTVSHAGGGKYTLKDGNHRVNAALRQGKRAIEARVQKMSAGGPIIIFEPGDYAKRVLAGTTWQDDELGQEIYKAVNKTADPKDSAGESRIARIPARRDVGLVGGGKTTEDYHRKEIDIPHGEHLQRIKHRLPMPLRPTAEQLEEGTRVRSSEVRAGDFRSESAVRGVIGKIEKDRRQPEVMKKQAALAEKMRNAETDREKSALKREIAELPKQYKANIAQRTAGSMERDTANFRHAIAQDARINHGISKAIRKRITGRPVGQSNVADMHGRSIEDALPAARERFDRHYKQRLESRRAKADNLYRRIHDRALDRAVMADEAMRGVGDPRKIAKLKLKLAAKHSKAVKDAVDASLGEAVPDDRRVKGKMQYAPRPELASIMDVPEEGLEKARQKYRSLRAPDAKENRRIQRAVIREGKFLTEDPVIRAATPPLRTGLKSFPMLKKIGIGGALVGGALVARKILKKPEREERKQLMSSRARVIQFAKSIGKITKAIEKTAAKASGKIVLTPEAERLIAKAEGKVAPIQKAKRTPKTKLTEEERMRREDAEMKAAEDAAAGKSQWTHPEHGTAQSVNYAKNAAYNEDELLKAANKKRREALPSDAPHSLHPNAPTYKDLADNVSQTNSHLRAEVERLEGKIKAASDPAMRRSADEASIRAGAAASKQIAAARDEARSAKEASTSRLRKGVSRVMGARRAALGRQADAHAAETLAGRERMYRNVAIGAGVGFLGGAALTGNESHQPKQPKRKQLEFSAAKAAVKGFAKGYIKTLPIPIPGVGEVAGIASAAKALREYKAAQREARFVAALMRRRPERGVREGGWYRQPQKKDDWITRDPDKSIIEIDNTGTSRVIRKLGSKQTAIRFERKQQAPPWRTAAISSALSGGLFGLLPGLKKSTAGRQVLKSALGGAALGATVGGGGTYIGTKIMGDPSKKDPTAITKRAALGGGIAGLGLGAAAVLALRRGKKVPFVGSLDEAAKTYRPAEFIRKAPAVLAVGSGALIGGLTAAAHGADEGQQVDTLRNLKKPVRMSSNLKPIRFATLAELLAAPILGAGIGAAFGKSDRKRAAKRGAIIGAAVPAGAAIGGSLLPAIIRRGSPLGAPIGAAAAAALAVAATRKKKDTVEMSAPSEVWANQGLTGKLAKDRFIKKMQDEDLDRRDANLLRTGLSGAALGGLIKGKAGAAIGAGAGLASVLGVRQLTKSGKDMYGDRTREGKQAEGLPWKATALGAGGLLAHRGYRKLQRAKVAVGKAGRIAAATAVGGAGLWAASNMFKSKMKTVNFEENEEYLRWKNAQDESKAEDRDWRKANAQVGKITQGVKRGTRLTKDIISAAKGQKNLDSRGRERVREWDKPWVRNLVTTGIAVGTLGLAHKVSRASGPNSAFARLKAAKDSGQLGRYMDDKVPFLKKIKDKLGLAKSQVEEEAASAASGPLGRFLDKVEKHSPPPPESTAKLVGEDLKKANAHRRRIYGIADNKAERIHGLSSSQQLIEFAYGDSVWDDRREGDLVALKKIRRRERREKALLERKDWQDAAVTPAKIGAGFIGGTLYGKWLTKPAGAAAHGTSPTPTPGNVTPFPQSTSHLDALVRSHAKKAARFGIRALESANPLARLNSILDALVA